MTEHTHILQWTKVLPGVRERQLRGRQRRGAAPTGPAERKAGGKKMGRAGMPLPGPCHTPCDTLHTNGTLTWEDFSLPWPPGSMSGHSPHSASFARLPATRLDNVFLIVEYIFREQGCMFLVNPR